MIFDKYFDKIESVKDLDKGLSNKSYIVNDKYVCKVYQNHVKNAEVQVSKLVKKWDVPQVVVNDEVKVTLFISGKTFEESSYTQENIIKFATVLKKFHEQKIVSGILFDPFARFEEYKSKITSPLYDFNEYGDFIKQVKEIWEKAEKQLCHNDLVPGNILMASNTYLIDWEYAGDNDYLFDLASFINENNLQDTNAKNVFLDWYFNREYSEELEVINMYDNFQSILWCAWANMMLNITGNEKFKEIANIKYSHIKK